MELPSSDKVLGVATNVITGFLGAGKSTAILHLLQAKPAAERWAVLVNEFGEVGIDGSLLQGSEEKGIFIREVPGGCMCCASGLPMQIALAMLLSQGRPQRLLIEPTGLGHPQEVLDTLTAEHYREALDLRATLTLVDPRKVRDSRYTDHPTFVQQLAVADVIVANKADLCSAEDFGALESFLERTDGLGGKPLYQVENGRLETDWLVAPAGHREPSLHSHHEHASESVLPPAPQIPEEGFLRIDNAGDGFFSQGWIFAPSWEFDAGRLDVLLMGVRAERVKGVFRTDQGVSAYNMVDDVMSKSYLVESADSRVEILSADQEAFLGLEEALLSCVRSRG